MNNEMLEKMVRELGAAIQDGEIYKAYIEAKAENDKDDALQENIKKLNLIRLQYNSEVSKSAADRDSEKINRLSKEFNGIYTEVMKNESMMKFESAKGALNSLMDRLNGILMLCANGEDPATCEPRSGCSGDCSGCSDGCE